MEISKKTELIDNLTREIWNKLIAEPKNKKGEFQVSPAKLRDIISKVI